MWNTKDSSGDKCPVNRQAEALSDWREASGRAPGGGVEEPLLRGQPRSGGRATARAAAIASKGF